MEERVREAPVKGEMLASAEACDTERHGVVACAGLRDVRAEQLIRATVVASKPRPRPSERR